MFFTKGLWTWRPCWTGLGVWIRCGSGLYGCMFSLMQGGEKLCFLQTAVRIVEKICLGLSQPFQWVEEPFWSVSRECIQKCHLGPANLWATANSAGCCSRPGGTRATSSPKGDMAFHGDEHIRRHLPTLIWPLIALSSRARWTTPWAEASLWVAGWTTEKLLVKASEIKGRWDCSAFGKQSCLTGMGQPCCLAVPRARLTVLPTSHR